MSDVQRLSVAGSERERALLRAGAEEAPSPRSVQAAARVLGIAPRAALVAYAIVTAAKGLKGSTLAAYVLAPAVAVGAIAVTGYAVAVGGGARTGDPAPVAHASVPVAPSATAVVAPPLAPVVTSAPVVEAPPAPVAPPKGVIHRAVRPRAEVPAALDEQVDLLDRARALSASGDASGALRALDDFDRRFGRSPMAEEAALLRIEATAARGDRSGAAALAQRFLGAHPRSVHAAKVRSIVGDGAN